LFFFDGELSSDQCYEIISALSSFTNADSEEIISIECFNFIVSQTTNHNHLDINIYPNPVNNFINIRDLESNLDLIIYNIFSLSGKIILSGRISIDSKINVVDLAKGVYFIEIINDKNERGIRRFIKK
jgi:hypothetical protein